MTQDAIVKNPEGGGYLYSVAAAGHLLGLDSRDVYSLIKTGRIQSARDENNFICVSSVEIVRQLGGQPITEANKAAAIEAHSVESARRREGQKRRLKRKQELSELATRRAADALGSIGRSDPHLSAAEAGPIAEAVTVTTAELVETLLTRLKPPAIQFTGATYQGLDALHTRLTAQAKEARRQLDCANFELEALQELCKHLDWDLFPS